MFSIIVTSSAVVRQDTLVHVPPFTHFYEGSRYSPIEAWPSFSERIYFSISK